MIRLIGRARRSIGAAWVCGQTVAAVLAGLLMAAQSVSAQERRADLIITVIDADTHAGIAGVGVSFPALHITQSTDSSGVARFMSVAMDTYRLEARRVGYDQIQLTVTVAGTEAITSLTVAMHASAHRLDSVRVVDSAPTLSEFEEHRARGIGQFITTAQMDSMVGSSLDAIFGRRIRGFRVVNDRSSGLHITSLR